MSELKPITTSTYSFPDLIGGGFVYVDKTAQIRELLRPAKEQYFLARPRRFGKSLMISTLQCIFEGRRELFRGLAIDRSDYDWTVHPVLRLDMGSCQASDIGRFDCKLIELLKSEAVRNGVEVEPASDPSILFTRLIIALAAKSPTGKMVLLLDEYDKPLLGKLGTPEVTKFKEALKEFYSVIKTQEQFQRFTFMTGVSKFSKVSIFSDLNNLTDLTMDARAATLMGYTHEELKENFRDHIAALAEKHAQTPDEAFAQMERMYDGFKFHMDAKRVFNPVSVGKCLVQGEYANFWFETGTPSFLIDLLKRNPVDDSDLRLEATAFGTFEPEQVRMLPLMYQTGYLTIKDVDRSGSMPVYTLGYPNREVEQSMGYHLALGMSCVPDDEFSSICNRICDGLKAGETDEVTEGLRCFFENIPYDLQVKYEKYYQSLFLSVMLMLKARVACEVKTARGRIDAVIETAKFVWVIEFKVRGTAAEAIAQIRERGYVEKFATDPRKVKLIGCAFDWEKRNIGEVEEV